MKVHTVESYLDNGNKDRTPSAQMGPCSESAELLGSHEHVSVAEISEAAVPVVDLMERKRGIWQALVQTALGYDMSAVWLHQVLPPSESQVEVFQKTDTS